MRWMTLAALVAAAALAVPATAQQQQQAARAEQRQPSTVLNVNAQGVSEARPDMAIVDVGVTVDQSTAQAASSENARRMTALAQTLRRAGLDERDIRTAHLRVQPIYDRRNSQQVITGYRAVNSVRANIRNIDNTGRVLDAVIAAGGNTINSVGFAHQDPDVQLNAARRDAAREARERAQLYAEAMGMRVHRVISISESGARAPSFMEDQIVVTGNRVGGGEAYTTPVAPGELETFAMVSVSFELR